MYYVSIDGNVNIDVNVVPLYTRKRPTTTTFKINLPMAISTTRARSLYRRLLRELPARSPSLLSNPSPVQTQIRSDFTSSQPPSSALSHKLDEAEQHVQYLKAQRMYITLVERYNPGMNMSEEEKVRLTARRVGMDLPIEMQGGGTGTKR